MVSISPLVDTGSCCIRFSVSTALAISSIQMWVCLSLLGTENQRRRFLQNSNIVQLFSMLKKDDRTKQMVYYQAGIGTYTSPQIATPFWSAVQKVSQPSLSDGIVYSLPPQKLDMMVANNLDAHVSLLYTYITA